MLLPASGRHDVEAVSTPETSVNCYQTTPHIIPEELSSYSRLREPESLPSALMFKLDGTAASSLGSEEVNTTVICRFLVNV
jgi:hypothetical protein